MKRRAFTIVELLVVISIIGLLAAAATLTLSNSQRRARDAKRIADIGLISDSIQQYVSLGNNVPTTSGAWASTTDGSLNILVTSGLLAAVPGEQNPIGTITRCMVYHYTAPTTNLVSVTGPQGAVGLRQYALSFPSETMDAAVAYNAMNSSIVSLSGYLKGASGTCTNGFLLGPKS